MSKPIFPKHEMFFICSILLLAIGLTGCIETFNRETISSQTIQVGNFVVEERIDHTGNWPDHTYERTYRASYNDGRWVDLGDFEDESQDGIGTGPVIVDGHLVVLSSAHTFIWQPDTDPIHFEPFSAAGWFDYSQVNNINGHYDFNAADAWRNSNRWFIGYKCDDCREGVPEKLLFYSLDNGQTFDVCLSPAPDYSSCLD